MLACCSCCALAPWFGFECLLPQSVSWENSDCSLAQAERGRSKRRTLRQRRALGHQAVLGCGQPHHPILREIPLQRPLWYDSKGPKLQSAGRYPSCGVERARAQVTAYLIGQPT